MKAIVQVINATCPDVRIWGGGGVKQTDICHALPSNCDLNFVFNAFIIRVAEFFADGSSEPTSVELRYPTS